MSLLFDRCIPVVLIHEGGFTDDKHDSGGATKYGISLRFLKGLKDVDGDGFLDGDINKDGIVNALDAQELTKDQAILLYHQYFWDEWYDQIACPQLVLHIFDMAVNASPRRAHILIQDIVGVKKDGIMGSNTIRAINNNVVFIAELYADARKKYYNSIVKKNPALSKFINGWLNRVKTTYFL
jgi:lysozyme family protein